MVELILEVLQGIRGVPTVIIYKKGVEVDRKVGGVPESHMKEFLDKNI
jgi:thioredoxin 1